MINTVGHSTGIESLEHDVAYKLTEVSPIASIHLQEDVNPCFT